MLNELFTKAFNIIESFLYLSLEVEELLENKKLLASGEYKKTVIDNNCVIILGSSSGNIIIYKTDDNIIIKNIKYAMNLKKPAQDRLIFTKLNSIIKSKKPN